MNIKRKISLLLLTTLIFYSLYFIIIQSTIWIQEINKVEKGIAKSDILKILRILDDEKEHLLTITADYAQWDATYNYVNNKDNSYIIENCDDNAMDTLQTDLFVILDDKSNIIYGRIRDSKSNWQYLSDSSVFKSALTKESINNGLSNLISVYGKVYIFAAHPVFPANRDKDSNGTFLLGRLLTTVMSNKLKGITGVGVNTYEIKPENASEKNRINNILLNSVDNVNENIAIVEKDSSIINSYKILTDVLGKDAAFIETATPRNMHLLLLKIQKNLWISLIFFSIFMVIFLDKLFNKIVSKPLETLSNYVESFHLDRYTEKTELIRLSEKNDEIGSLARSFSKMKKNIIEKHIEIISLNKTLEDKVNKRTLELEKVNQELILSEKILTETTEGVCITDMEGTILKVNDSFCTLSGYSREELLGKNPKMFKSNKHDKSFYKNMWTQLINTGYWSGEIWDRKKNGEIYPTWMSINAIKYGSSKVTHYIGICSDISKIKNAEENIKHMAYYDSLTGLPNRLLFNEILERSINRAVKYNKLTVLMFLDLDRFKNVNDTLGHTIGDQVLVEVANRIKGIIKKSDTVARLGGDEFVLILEEINPNQELTFITDRIIKDISKLILIDTHKISVGVSIGIAIAPVDDNTVEGLVMKADSTMYYSKENGRGQYTFYSEEIQRKNEIASDTEKKIKKALELNEFSLFLQPKISVSQEGFSIVGAEALIRITPQGGKPIMPDQFIRIAEDTGLIVPIGKWVIEEACRLVSILKIRNENFHIAVNISVKQFEDKDLVNTIKEAIEKNNISPHNIEIEITESLFYKNVDRIIEILSEIRNFGCKIGIDDFGTGYSTLSSLSKLPIDYLKIDKSFVDKLGDSTEKELVSTIVSISQNLNMGTVVEGVETLNQLNILKKYQPIYIQGYYFSKPLEFESFVHYCKNFEKEIAD